MAAQVKVVGLDTAKQVFQVHGADGSGRAVLRKRLRRNQLSDFFANLPQCLVGLEATQGAHYWALILTPFGHEATVSHCLCVLAQPGNASVSSDARKSCGIRMLCPFAPVEP
jgi:transposase